MTTARPSTPGPAALRRQAEAELRDLRVWRDRRPMMAELHRKARARWGKARLRLRLREKGQGPAPAGTEVPETIKRVSEEATANGRREGRKGRAGGAAGPRRAAHRESISSHAGAEARRLVHELQVHQVELELQNAELQETRDRLQELLAHYTELYDFAPVGYFTLTTDGTVRLANLAGARHVGLERGRLIGRRLGLHLAPEGRPGFGVFLHQVFGGNARRFCEVPLLGDGSDYRVVRLEADGALRRTECRVVMVDVTERLRAEAAQRRVLALSASNRKLEREVARRELAERGLKKSEQDLERMLARSNRMQVRLRDLSRRVLRVQEEERKRISRELHDVVAQTLAAINVQLAGLGQDPVADPEVLAGGIARTQRLVEQAVQVVHQFARELRPTVLDDLGLIPALRSFVRTFIARTGLAVRLTAFAGGDSLDGSGRTALFRVAQEALINVARHARATRATVTLRRRRDQICMRVRDNGRSFRVDQVLQARGGQHLGLLGMRERLEMVGGSLEIFSRPGEGTIISACVPRDGVTSTSSRSPLRKPVLRRGGAKSTRPSSGQPAGRGVAAAPSMAPIPQPARARARASRRPPASQS